MPEGQTKTPPPANVEVAQPSKANNFIGKLQTAIDRRQLQSRRLSFVYAVLKKYGQDQGGNQAALVTYYGFLSLFPLLIAALSVTQLTVMKSLKLRGQLTNGLNRYFPMIGHQLENNLHGSHKAGVALIISAVLTIYGARGVAIAFQQAMNHIWQVPRYKRSGFPKSVARSLTVIAIVGLGFIVTGFLSSYGAGIGGSIGKEIAAYIISFVLTLGILLLVYKVSISPKKTFSQLMAGSISAAIGLQIIQAAAGFIIAHELKHFSSLYGSLAIVFVLLFWIYLQVRIVLYGTEIDSIRFFKLWPRSITNFRLTEADRRALALYAQREELAPAGSEQVSVSFDTTKPE